MGHEDERRGSQSTQILQSTRKKVKKCGFKACTDIFKVIFLKIYKSLHDKTSPKCLKCSVFSDKIKWRKMFESTVHKWQNLHLAPFMSKISKKYDFNDTIFGIIRNEKPFRNTLNNIKVKLRIYEKVRLRQSCRKSVKMRQNQHF